MLLQVIEAAQLWERLAEFEFTTDRRDVLHFVYANREYTSTIACGTMVYESTKHNIPHGSYRVISVDIPVAVQADAESVETLIHTIENSALFEQAVGGKAVGKNNHLLFVKEDKILQIDWQMASELQRVSAALVKLTANLEHIQEQLNDLNKGE